MRNMNRRDFLGLVGAGVTWAALPGGCGKDNSHSSLPNILWIVWDTVRADYLGLYGYNKPTTPFLDKWSQEARVFENCVSVASTTVPTHASMFTGLMPSEHRRSNTENYLGDEFTTIAELLQSSGYQTYLYSANPHISRKRNFTQGFDTAEHPWDDKYKYEALRVVRGKIAPQDRSSELTVNIRSSRISQWMIKASGELAQRGVEKWLTNCKRNRPFFIFLNYMEAHQPYVPPESYRERLMNAEQVKNSYKVDRSWAALWSYTFGKKQYSKQETELTRLTYAATVAELDGMLENLLKSLEAGGYLDNTIVVVTSDHGEHLGEHHMLDHQYSVYEQLMRVPLVIRYPQRFSPGRDTRPVMNSDLFPTVLELAGIEIPEGLQSKAVSLLRPRDERIRVGEYPSYPMHAFNAVKRVYPNFDPTPWCRSLRAVYQAENKYIWASDGRYELYNLAADPGESKNLIDTEANLTKKLAGIHDRWVVSLNTGKAQTQRGPALTEEERKRLESLGYVGSEQE